MFDLELDGENTFEAVTLAEVKAHARIFTSADDDYCSELLISAREQVERDLEMPVVGQKFKLHLDHWYDYRQFESWYQGYGYRGAGYFPQSGWLFYPHIPIPVQPVQSIDSITYTDTSSAAQTLDPTLYRLKAWKDPPHIMLLGALPGILAYSDIVVSFTAGPVSTTPALIKHAVLFLAAHWYEHREAAGESLIRQTPDAYERIINRLRVKRFH